METKNTLSEDSKERKSVPVASGVMDYFPAALAYIARVSKAGNDKHNPGQPLHWARGKSMDHADCIARHLLDRGGFDGELRHSGMLAWRALALLQEELEREEGAPLPRGAWEADDVKPDTQPRDWREGWTCLCGSTELYSAYQSEEEIEAYGPVCNNMDCDERMVRA